MTKMLQSIEHVEGHKIEFCDLREVGQGGPEAGYLEIDGIRVSDNKFGFPSIILNDKLYSTLLRLFGKKNGFTICEIDLNTKSVNESDNTNSIITLDHIDDEILYFSSGTVKNQKKDSMLLIDFELR